MAKRTAPDGAAGCSHGCSSPQASGTRGPRCLHSFNSPGRGNGAVRSRRRRESPPPRPGQDRFGGRRGSRGPLGPDGPHCTRGNKPALRRSARRPRCLCHRRRTCRTSFWREYARREEKLARHSLVTRCPVASFVARRSKIVAGREATHLWYSRRPKGNEESDERQLKRPPRPATDFGVAAGYSGV